MKFIVFLFSIICTSSFAQLKSPEEFFVTGYGDNFTPHHLLVDYAQHLAANSTYMTLEEYGMTNEKRPLILATFTSETNRGNIEQIRKSNLANAGFMEMVETDKNEKSIIWLSFGVHGNEAGGPESAINVMYKLANPDMEMKKFLEDAVILIDPTINPDGYSRYTNWHWQVSGKKLHPRMDDREHIEPWPGGRVNHYLFDLNRDWAWQTQVETQQRMVKYNQWLPHIHVDYHEMGHNAHYYFAPAAKPYHTYITDFQRDFQKEIGKSNAAYFDSQLWMYFTRETYDLLYPSYGDTYPTFNGAIGMTYEQAGHSRAGRAIELNNGDILKLRDRIDHHTATAITTIRTTLANKDRVIKQFKEYFTQSRTNPKGNFKGYVIKKSNNQVELTKLLERNKIEFSYSSERQSETGYDYFTETETKFTIEKGDLIIDAYQPKSTLLQVLFEPEPMLEDSLTYDITAWSLPFAYGVQAYGLGKTPSVRTTLSINTPMELDCNEEPYAYYFEWGTTASHQTLAALLEKDVHLRISSSNAQFGDTKLSGKSLVAITGDNRHLEDFHQEVRSILGPVNIVKGCLSTGLSLNGNDLGGGNFKLLQNPRILTISGDRVGNNAFGQIWHFFENHLKYPISVVNIDDLNQVNMPDFDVFILPDGYYSLTKERLEDIYKWVNDGGKLIAIGTALRNLSEKEGFALSTYATEEEKKIAEKAAEDLKIRERLESYGGLVRRSMRNSVPGAIVRNKVDESHPLAYGLGKHYYSLKTSSATYGLLKDAWNVVYVPEGFESYGFIGSLLKNRLINTVSYAVEEKGSGTVVYMVDNPLYRGFWHGGLNIFANAVFLVD